MCFAMFSPEIKLALHSVISSLTLVTRLFAICIFFRSTSANAMANCFATANWKINSAHILFTVLVFRSTCTTQTPANTFVYLLVHKSLHICCAQYGSKATHPYRADSATSSSTLDCASTVWYQKKVDGLKAILTCYSSI